MAEQQPDPESAAGPGADFDAHAGARPDHRAGPHLRTESVRAHRHEHAHIHSDIYANHNSGSDQLAQPFGYKHPKRPSVCKSFINGNTKSDRYGSGTDGSKPNCTSANGRTKPDGSKSRTYCNEPTKSNDNRGSKPFSYKQPKRPTVGKSFINDHTNDGTSANGCAKPDGSQPNRASTYGYSSPKPDYYS